MFTLYIPLWIEMTKNQNPQSPNKQNQSQCVSSASHLCDQVDWCFEIWLTWRTDKEEPLSEWPLPALAHPESSPAKTEREKHVWYNPHKRTSEYHGEHVENAYNGEQCKLLKEFLGIISIKVSKVSCGQEETIEHKVQTFVAKQTPRLSE